MRKRKEKTQSVDNDSNNSELNTPENENANDDNAASNDNGNDNNENGTENDKKKTANQAAKAQANLLEKAWKKAGFEIVSVKPTEPTKQSWRQGDSRTPQVALKTESGLDKVPGSFTITTKRGDQQYEYKHTQKDGKTYITLPSNLAKGNNLSKEDKAEIGALAKLSPGGTFTGTYSKAFVEEFIDKSGKTPDFSNAKILDEGKKEYKCEKGKLSEVEKTPEAEAKSDADFDAGDGEPNADDLGAAEKQDSGIPMNRM